MWFDFGMIDRRQVSTMSDFWSQHRVAIVFVATVFVITMLFAFILFILKCLEERRKSSSSGASGNDRRSPVTDRAVTTLLEKPQEALHGGKRWWGKLSELLAKIGLLSATCSHHPVADV